MPSRPARAAAGGPADAPVRAAAGNPADGPVRGVGVGAEPDWLADFDYDLPDASIARQPAAPRDASRLFILDRASGARTQVTFRHLPRFLRAGDLLVRNETRVLKARVFTRLARSGRPVEVLFSHPEEDGWVAMLGPGRRLKPGDRLLSQAKEEDRESRGDPLPDLVLDHPVGSGLWRLRPEGGAVEALMERAGHVPLPPYLSREDCPLDRDWYQTVYARTDGAVAAPTAGLHFTDSLFAALAAIDVRVASVLLHVGPGTFLPVRAARPAEHRVLPERYEVTAETVAAIGAARSAGGRVVAIGTTTVRALETAAALPGAAGTPSGLRAGSGWTDCTILPPHRFRAVDAMITNFHLPRSSLLLLVAAFAGRERVLSAYAEARDAGFRFYSYGDAMLIL
jgi:S-adenosylmethionine:tRNA ribosyltransferase-isomerase